MRTIDTTRQWHKCYREIVDRGPSFLYVSTFGLGWTEPVKQALCVADRVIVGFSASLCKPGCDSCKASNRKRYESIIDTLDDAGCENFLVTGDLHMKAVVSDKGCIVGGMNLTESSWDDVSFMVEPPALLHPLKDRFNALWATKEPVKSPDGSKKPIVPFGKHKGRSVFEILDIDPLYVEWALNHTDWMVQIVNTHGIYLQVKTQLEKIKP